MPRGDKSKYTGKQERSTDRIAVNKESGRGKKSGSGRGKTEGRAAPRKGGSIGGRASAARSSAARSAPARKAAATRKRRGGQRTKAA